MDRQKKGLATSSFPSSVSFSLPFPYRFFFSSSPDLKEWLEIIHMTYEDILLAKTCSVTEKTQVCSPLPPFLFPTPPPRQGTTGTGSVRTCPQRLYMSSHLGKYTCFLRGAEGFMLKCKCCFTRHKFCQQAFWPNGEC